MTRRRASRKNSLLRQREASSGKGHSRKSARALLRPPCREDGGCPSLHGAISAILGPDNTGSRCDFEVAFHGRSSQRLYGLFAP